MLHVAYEPGSKRPMVARILLRTRRVYTVILGLAIYANDCETRALRLSKPTTQKALVGHEQVS